MRELTIKLLSCAKDSDDLPGNYLPLVNTALDALREDTETA